MKWIGRNVWKLNYLGSHPCSIRTVGWLFGRQCFQFEIHHKIHNWCWILREVISMLIVILYFLRASNTTFSVRLFYFCLCVRVLVCRLGKLIKLLQNFRFFRMLCVFDPVYLYFYTSISVDSKNHSSNSVGRWNGRQTKLAKRE